MVIKEENNSLASNEKRERLSKWQKFCLGWTFATALLGVCLGVDNGSVALIAVSVCAIIVLACSYTGKIDRKYTWPVVITTYVVLAYIYGSILDKQDEVKPEPMEQKQGQPKPAPVEQKQGEAEDVKKAEEQTPKKSPKDEIRELGYNDGIEFGRTDGGNTLREYIQMGIPKERGLTQVQDVIAKVFYKEEHGSNISDELLDEYAKQFLEGYKSVVLKK